MKQITIRNIKLMDWTRFETEDYFKEICPTFKYCVFLGFGRWEIVYE